MVIPAAPAAAERHEVRGVNGLRIKQRVRFAEFETAPVRRGWTRTQGIRVLGFGGGRSTQGYEFLLRAGGVDAWSGACRTRASAAVVELGRGSEISSTRGTSLSCDLVALGDGVDWLLTLPAGVRPLPVGLATSAEGEVRVVASNRVVGTLPTLEPVGYHLYEGERLLASVEVMNGGAVIFQPGMTGRERSLVGAIATALLLMDDLTDAASGN
jgi:hypothetical protein